MYLMYVMVEAHVAFRIGKLSTLRWHGTNMIKFSGALERDNLLGPFSP